MQRGRQARAPGSLGERFYLRDTAVVARDLLGCRVVRRAAGEPDRALVVVETEAYLGPLDRAAHTWNGRRTRRVLPMWGPGGHAYVFRVYGLHDCLNVVTGAAGRAEAVLIRAGVPLEWWAGLAVPRAEALAASGPGRVCRYLGVTTALSGAPLSGPELFLERGPRRRFGVLVGPRVGVDYAGEAAAWPLRFAVEGCPAVTRRAALRPLGEPGGAPGPDGLRRRPRP